MIAGGFTTIQGRTSQIIVPNALLRVYANMTEASWHIAEKDRTTFGLWQPYIKKHQGLVISALIGLFAGRKISLCIIGVENGFDIPWDFFERIANSNIERIVLVDLDNKCMERRRETLSADLRSRVEIVQADASLVVCSALSDVLEDENIATLKDAEDKFLERCDSGTKDLLPFTDQEFDLVLSTQIMNQLLTQPLKFLREEYKNVGGHTPKPYADKKEGVTHKLQIGHIQELFRLTRLGGKILISHIPSKYKVSPFKSLGFNGNITVDGKNFWTSEEEQCSAKLEKLLRDARECKGVRMNILHSERWGWLQKPPQPEIFRKGSFLTIEGVILERI